MNLVSFLTTLSLSYFHMSDTVRSKPAKRGTRNSLSCSQCRYKHIRCDGRKPVCSRCATNTVQCVYPVSRRRGNPKPGKAPLSSVRDVYETSIDSSLQTSTVGSSSSVTINGEMESSSNSSFSLLSLYYEFFHAAHPCALPFENFKTGLNEARIQPLLQVMCYVGSFFFGYILSISYFGLMGPTCSGLSSRNSVINPASYAI